LGLQVLAVLLYGLTGFLGTIQYFGQAALTFQIGPRLTDQ
jgi:hypothetical protein